MTTVFTIGHSTRPVGEFIRLLQLHGITQLVDIRTVPKSRHNPQFGQDELEKTLKQANIKYDYIKDLGGLRPKSNNSINMGWHNDSFRNYADYMQNDKFIAALDELIAKANKSTTAIMCAEAVPWRCHRSLVGDALTIRDITVTDIISKTNAQAHHMTPFARVEGLSLTYPTDTPE